MVEQGNMMDAEIDALVEQLDQADTALAIHVQCTRRTGDTVRDLLEIRTAILRWCADPHVTRCVDGECVRATAVAVQTMTLLELSDYVRALEHLGRRASLNARGVA
jgi:hypothetical protein